MGQAMSWVGPQPPRNLNRYLTRYVDIDLVRSSGEAFMFVKMGPAIILGFIQGLSKIWRGTAIYTKPGVVGGHMTVPGGFDKYLFDRASKGFELEAALSKRQKQVIEESYRRDPDRVSKSSTLDASLTDATLFRLERPFPRPKGKNHES